ncbi:Bromodomain-containing protein [Rhizopogon salebrosus TDB-379]|nr:Bromodomain-containing protein [Rhizopogon salebrosus TDB-379]
MCKAKVPKHNGTAEQLKYCAKILSDLWRQQHWDVAHLFYEPIDAVKLDIPAYYKVIKKPMDMLTMQKKLDAGEYPNATKSFEDFKLMIWNCFIFNPSGTPVNQAGIDLQQLFDEKWKHLPPLQDANPPTPPKDLPYANVPKKMCKAKVPKHNGTAEQLKYCAKILSDLRQQQHWNVAHPFYEPIDAVKLDIPTYYKVIKKPMDMLTMWKKLNAGEYPNTTKFFKDFKLMIQNCFIFDPSGMHVNQAGIDLQQLFDEKWKHLPPLQDASDDEDDSLRQSTTRG